MFSLRVDFPTIDILTVANCRNEARATEAVGETEGGCSSFKEIYLGQCLHNLCPAEAAETRGQLKPGSDAIKSQ